MMKTSITENSQKFWSFLENNRGSTRISGQYDDVYFNSPHDIVNVFAHYFSSVYVSGDTDVRRGPVGNTSLVDISCIIESEVHAAIKKLKNRMTTGPDGIPSFLVRDCVSVFV
ncbi:hypothetical protein Trydic_g423 [Trypoxylus dichotomus]